LLFTLIDEMMELPGPLYAT